MPVGYTAQQIRDAEKPHLDAGEPLMARAAAGLASAIEEILRQREPSEAAARVLVIAGSGSNGGDALFAAARLVDGGAHVDVALTGSHTHTAGLASATDAGARVIQGEDADDVSAIVSAAQEADVVVDAIVGTGASSPLRDRARIVVTALRPVLTSVGGPTVVACDIPSGIGVDDGSLPDDVVLPADLTVTFGALKAGLLLEPAASVAGRIRLVDVGIGDALADVEPVVDVPDSERTAS